MSCGYYCLFLFLSSISLYIRDVVYVSLEIAIFLAYVVDGITGIGIEIFSLGLFFSLPGSQ